MKWKISTILTLLLLLITNGYWLYKTTDEAVTLTYHDQVTFEFAQSINDLSKLCDYFIAGMSSDSIKSILEKQFNSENIFEKDSVLNASQIAIIISDNRAIKLEKSSLVEVWLKTNQ